LTSKPAAKISVRRQLFRWLLLPLVLVALVATVAGYPVALHPATAAYDWALMDGAYSLAELVKAKKAGGGLSLPDSADILLRTDQFDKIYYSVRDAAGALVAGDQHLPPPPPGVMTSGETLYDSRINGDRVRIAALRVRTVDSSYLIQVAETTVKRNRLVTQTLTGLLVSELLLVAVVIVLVWFGIGKGLAPLQRLREEIESRSPRDLRPVPEEHAPVEVQPVVQALNNLLQQLGATLRSQQQFVANAAHQLRTPLAGQRMQVEYGLQQREPAEWRRVLVTMKLATERTVHLANQLLTLAKAELGSHQLEFTRWLDLRSVVEEVTGEWMPRAIAKEIDLGLELASAPVNGDALLIGELLSNLLDNAITYTPAGGRVTIRSSISAAFSVLEVEDEGIGIAVEEREKVFRRFYRVEGSPGEGCGLGLAIVHEIAHLHGGTVEIRLPTGGRGTLVVVRFVRAGGSAVRRAA
jgi:two-component system sensor histidine kinase TctE